MWGIILVVAAIITFCIIISFVGDLKASTFVTSIIITVIFFLLTISSLIFSYKNLTDETPIATLYFETKKDVSSPSNKHVYIARFVEPRELRSEAFDIYGDQWRIDAQFLKMKNLANLIGIKPKYYLERIEGRYSDINLQNSAEKKAYLLQDGDYPSIFNWNPFVDAEYGTSSYVNISTDRDFKVYRTNSGIYIQADKKEPNTKGECRWYNTLWCDA